MENTSLLSLIISNKEQEKIKREAIIKSLKMKEKINNKLIDKQKIKIIEIENFINYLETKIQKISDCKQEELEKIEKFENAIQEIVSND